MPTDDICPVHTGTNNYVSCVLLLRPQYSQHIRHSYIPYITQITDNSFQVSHRRAETRSQLGSISLFISIYTLACGCDCNYGIACQRAMQQSDQTVSNAVLLHKYNFIIEYEWKVLFRKFSYFSAPASRNRSNSMGAIVPGDVAFTVPKAAKHNPTMFGQLDSKQINRDLYEHRVGEKLSNGIISLTLLKFSCACIIS